MLKFNDKNNPDIVQGMHLHGFVVEQIMDIKEMSVVCYVLTHEKTHAKYFHLSNDDPENTFSVAFKTVPCDDTGVAHILEHTVLCGSSKYPVRDPFFSMIKRSMKSFMNAFTASDWTMYPFSTQNLKDYYNLMDVYLDAAFFPKLSELSFKQEGHRLELEDTDDLVYKGIVYNEMKGAMSSPSQIMSRGIMNAIYPTTTYSFNSGGAPEKIPELTYEDFKAFHKRYYHPSNSFFYSYGNFSLKDHLDHINSTVLSTFSPIDPKTDVPHEPRWDTPREKRWKYPLSKTENPEKKAQICLAWLMTDIADAYMVLCLSLLEQVLIGNSASPLRKALIDSGLGTSLSNGTGYDPELRDTMFACGLKDVRVQDADAIEKIIMDVFHDLVKHGIEKELIETAIHQLEFHRKEVTNSPYPYGIKLLLHVCSSWFHVNDPIRPMLIEKDLEQLNADLTSGPFFETLIEKYFINNPHRIRFVLEPDQEMQQNEENHVQSILKDKKQSLTQEQINTIKKDAAELTSLQDAPEDLTILPTLTVKDVPPDIVVVSENQELTHDRLTCFEQPTRGIVYFGSSQGINALPEKYIMRIPFFCFAFSRIGTKDYDYVELAKRIDRYTGGLGISSIIRRPVMDDTDPMALIHLNAKCLERNIHPMFDILNSLFFRFDFSNTKRIKHLLLELKSGVESGVVSNGHQYAVAIASRKWSKTRALDERWYGLSQLKFLKALTEDLSHQKLSALADDLTEMAHLLFSKNQLHLSAIGDSDSLKQILQPIQQFQNNIPAQTNTTPLINSIDLELKQDPQFEAWTTATSVSFVAQSFKGVRRMDPDAPTICVISKLLRSLYLHKEIREKGGAYGAFATADMEEGLFHLISYRDPHVRQTLQTFAKVSDFICEGSYSDTDIQEAVLQVCSDIDRPDSPSSKARKAFWRKLTGLSDEMRQEFKANVLSVTRSQVMDVAEKYFKHLDQKGTVGVISNAEKMAMFNQQEDGKRVFEVHAI
ncbi:MAG: insulinase family protein [Candidatus Magnetomorum sp.]|nr:insulinase family protein [Candidatus Magnetomorum sp.]